MTTQTDLRTETTETLRSIVAGHDPRSASHICRLIADREIESRKLKIPTWLQAKIDELRATMAGIDKIDPAGDTYRRLTRFLDARTDQELQLLHAAKIKFVGPLALNRLVRRGNEPPRYNAAAVDQAIASSNRAGRRIGGREAKMIHAVLKGRGRGGEA
jgi:hypothetical protein